MRPQLIIFLLSLALLQFQVGAFRFTTVPIIADLQDLTTYIHGFADFFNVDSEEMIACYDDSSASAQFQAMSLQLQLNEAFIAGNKALVESLSSRLAPYNEQLEKVIACLNQTKEFHQIAADAGFTNLANMTTLMSLYQQGEFPFADSYNQPILGYIMRGDFESAGNLAGQFFKDMAGNATTFVFKNKAQGFHYGEYFYFDLSSPVLYWDCFNESDAVKFMYFFTGWAQSVVAAGKEGAAKATGDFMNQTGIPLLGQLKDFFACKEATPNQQAFNKAIGTNPHGSNFVDEVIKFIGMQPDRYFDLMSQMNSAAVGNNFIELGTVQTILYQEIGRATAQTE